MLLCVDKDKLSFLFYVKKFSFIKFCDDFQNKSAETQFEVKILLFEKSIWGFKSSWQLCRSHTHTHTHTHARTHTHTHTHTQNVYSLLFTMMCFHILKWPLVAICVIGIHPGDQRRAITSPTADQSGARARRGGGARLEKAAQLNREERNLNPKRLRTR